jgi:hypothetical protein
MGGWVITESVLLFVPDFYWYLESRSSPSTDPLVVWLTGGPGCSSVLALLVENGPCSVKPDASGTTLNPYSWTSNANGKSRARRHAGRHPTCRFQPRFQGSSGRLEAMAVGHALVLNQVLDLCRVVVSDVNRPG